MSEKRDKAHIEEVETTSICLKKKREKESKKIVFNYRHAIKRQGHNGIKNKEENEECAINGIDK